MRLFRPKNNDMIDIDEDLSIAEAARINGLKEARDPQSKMFAGQSINRPNLIKQHPPETKHVEPNHMGLGHHGGICCSGTMTFEPDALALLGFPELDQRRVTIASG